MAEFFNNGLEEGDFSAWTGTTGSPTVSADYAREGTKALKDTTSSWGQEFAYKDLGGNKAAAYYRAYVMWTAGTPANGDNDGLGFMWFGSGSSTPIAMLNIHNTGGTYYWALRYNSGAWTNAISAVSVTTSTNWHCVEIYVSNAVLKVWVDGDLIIDLSGKSCGTSWRYVGAGTYWNNGSGNATLYVDSVIVADAQIGEISEGGTAYDATVTDLAGLDDAVENVFTGHVAATDKAGLKDVVANVFTAHTSTAALMGLLDNIEAVLTAGVVAPEIQHFGDVDRRKRGLSAVDRETLAIIRDYLEMKVNS